MAMGAWGHHQSIKFDGRCCGPSLSIDSHSMTNLGFDVLENDVADREPAGTSLPGVTEDPIHLERVVLATRVL
jgi:hypothetical protein